MHTYLDKVEKDGKEGKLNSQWKDGKYDSPWLENFEKILKQNMGELPAVIDYDKKVMSPLQFSEEILSIP